MRIVVHVAGASVPVAEQRLRYGVLAVVGNGLFQQGIDRHFRYAAKRFTAAKRRPQRFTPGFDRECLLDERARLERLTAVDVTWYGYATPPARECSPRAHP